MGNRAVVSVEGSKVGVYLHWNGGPESVSAFLRAAKDLGVRSPQSDTSYFYARFVQIVGNFFGGTTSVGIDSIDHLDTDNGDNGLYIVNDKFEVIERKHTRDRAPFDAAKSEAIYQNVMKYNREVFKGR